MKRRNTIVTAALLFAGVHAGGSAVAQDSEGFDLREALMDHFRTRLRVELNLTDEQTEKLFPVLEAQESERQRVNRERAQLRRELQQAFQQGAPDAELEDLLRRSDEVDASWFRTQRELQSRIDGTLTVRQRVKLRFFVQAFREEVQRRLRESRDDRMQRRQEWMQRRDRRRPDGRP